MEITKGDDGVCLMCEYKCVCVCRKKNQKQIELATNSLNNSGLKGV